MLGLSRRTMSNAALRNDIPHYTDVNGGRPRYYFVVRDLRAYARWVKRRKGKASATPAPTPTATEAPSPDTDSLPGEAF